MKANIKYIFALLVAVVTFGLTSCQDDPYKYVVADGHPSVMYARLPDAAAADSLIEGALMGNFICLVGDNLKSTVELYFNDQQAYLNTSLITDHTMLVQVPSSIPVDVQNKIYLHGQDGEIVEYPFNVIVPGPTIASISNEFATPGMKTTLYGDYFLDAEIDPFVLTLPDGTELKAEDVELSKMAITFTVPETYAGDMGNITVHTVYGNATSPFIFHDTRNIIVDFDGNHGYAGGNGWRASLLRVDASEIPALDGNFACLGGNMDANGGWADDPFELDMWYTEGAYDFTTLPTMAAVLEENDIENLVFKFEVFVPSSSPWSSGAFQVIWMGETNGNGPHADGSYARGLWNPWAGNGGSYDTGGEWRTVAMPLKDFVYGPNGEAASTGLTIDSFKGLTIFVFQGGVAGTECTPKIAFDNLRVVPLN